jgi:plasmid stabilization system protein ParE
MRPYAVLRGAKIGRDFSRIRQHLIRSYQEFGDTKAIATERANARIRAAFDYMLTFATHPHRGTVHPELRDSVRHVTAQQFVYYFEIDDHRAEVRILTVFFGGEDHSEQIAERLRE